MKESAVNRIIALFIAQQQGIITAPEQQELDGWANASANNQEFVALCQDKLRVAASLEKMDQIDAETAWQQFLDKYAGNEPASVVPLRRRPWKWVAAACVVGVLITAAWFFGGKDSQPGEFGQNGILTKGEDIQPGSNKAILTLGDGRTIVLDNKQDGLLAQENGASVSKKGDGLVYAPAAPQSQNLDKEEAIMQHTVSTPVGGFYALTLPDKTKVWLNADTRITYPTVFTGKERKVVVIGETYLEVAKDAARPFIVVAGNTEVKVLGTHFNVRSYRDEVATKTTLLEGSVQIEVEEKEAAILTAGQQATVITATQSNKSLKIAAVDVDAVVAWKNGYFDFRAATLLEVMKEIKRWYVGVEAIEIEIPVDDRFTAAIPRNLPLSTLLTILQETSKAHFEIKDRTIIVRK